MATPESAAEGGLIIEQRPTLDPNEEVESSSPTSEGDVASRLRDARRAAGLTQQAVADKLGVSRRAVSEWETGVRQPHVALPGLSALYGVSTSFLLYGVETASVELRELRAEVAASIERVDTLIAEMRQTRADLVALAEATEAAFAELRLLIEAKESELRDNGEKPPDDRPDGAEQRESEA